MDVADKQTKLIENKIQWIKDKSKEATTLTAEVKTKNTRYIKIVADLENINSQVILLNTQYKSYQAKERAIEINLNKAQRFYDNTFLTLKNKIDDKDKGLKKAISESEKLIKELKTKREQVIDKNLQYQANLKELNAILASSKKSQESALKADKEVIAFKKNIEENFNNAEKLLKNIQDIVNDSHKNNNKIIALLENSQTVFGEIEKIKSSAEVSQLAIQSYENDSKDINAKISDIYKIATNTGLAGAFQNIKSELEIELNKWNNKIFYSSVFLLVSVFGLFLMQVGLNKWELKGLNYDFYLRFLVATPVIYYLLFCGAQYNNVRAKLDKYTYKTTLALSIEAHTELLNKNFNDEKYQGDILKFSLDSLDKIYDRPYIDDYLMAQLKLSIKAEEESKSTIESVKKELLSKDSELMKLITPLLDSVKDKK